MSTRLPRRDSVSPFTGVSNRMRIDFFSRNRNASVFCFLAVIFVNLVIYWPSFFHMPRSDQWWYLLNTAGKNNFCTLVGDYYSYNRVRVFVPQEVISFRPLWMVFLAAEKSLFGNNFILWQGTGIVLHLVVLFFLYGLLNKLQKSPWLAAIFTLFFSVILGAQEMVIWHHANPYLIFCILVLAIFHQFYTYHPGFDGQSWRIWVIFGGLLFAVFIFELGSFFSLLCAGFIFYQCWINPGKYKAWWGILLIMPAIFYLVFDYYDYIGRSLAQHYPAAFIDGGCEYLRSFGNIFFIVKFFAISLYALLCLFFIPLFPALWQWEPLDRLMLLPVTSDFVPIYLVNLLVAALLLGFFSSAVSWSAWHRNRLIAGFSAALAVIFILITGLARFMRSGIVPWISVNNYYFYFFWLFFIIVMGSLVDKDRLSAWAKSIKVFLCVIFFVAVAYCGWRVYDINLRYARSAARMRSLADHLSVFISQHKMENDFSFAFTAPPIGDSLIPVIRYERALDGSFVTKEEKFYKSYILFKKYINYDHPKYLVQDYPGQGIVIAAAKRGG